MKFVNYAVYITDAARVVAVRPAHREYIKTLLTIQKLAVAGPLNCNEAGIYVYEANSLEEAEELARNDPYKKEGIWASFKVSLWDVGAFNPNLFGSTP